MSKVDTDQGLGPGSEGRRREVKAGQEELESRSKLKSASPAVSAPASQDAASPPVSVTPVRKSDTVDELLDGFGTSRPDLPRILPKADTTPPPEPVRRELTPTAPGARQRRNRAIATLLAFVCIAALGIAIVRSRSSSRIAPPSATATATVTATATATVAAPPPALATTLAEALPTVAKTSAPRPSARPVHRPRPRPSDTETARPASTATLAPHPPASAPPGWNLLPDDPHR